MEVFYSWRGNKTLQRYNFIVIVNSSAVQADRFNKYKILLPSELHKYVDKYSLSYWYVQHTWLKKKDSTRQLGEKTNKQGLFCQQMMRSNVWSVLLIICDNTGSSELTMKEMKAFIFYSNNCTSFKFCFKYFKQMFMALALLKTFFLFNCLLLDRKSLLYVGKSCVKRAQMSAT